MTLRLVGVVLLGCVAAIASGQTPTGAENLLFSPPMDFKVGFQSNGENRLMTEWVPASQTVEDWTEMVTLQIYRGGAVAAADFLQGVRARYLNDCPGTTTEKGGIFTGQVNGYVVSMMLLKCPRNPGTGKPETTAFRAIRGKDALYLVQHAWRTVPSEQEMNVAMQAFAKVTVCDTGVPDHPCPLGVSAWPVQVNDALSSVFSRERNVYLHVVLEKPNGTDIRARTLPKELIAKAEAEGKQVRPTRDSQFVESYWALLTDGSFKSFERGNYGKDPPQATALTYAELERLFVSIPRFAKWTRETDLALGGTHFSVRVITADDPGAAGKKGELELGWLEEGKPVYFYYCVPIVKSDDAPNGAPPQMQPWQVRRAAYESLAQRLRQGDFSAGKDYDAVLTEFDTRPFSRTPIEELEIIGDFYIPKEGLDPALSVVVMHLVLGWYDALRFASESGRAEIVNYEGLFREAFARGGPDVTNKAVKFLQDNPDRAHALIAQGIATAEKWRETGNYDRHWPMAYGLERSICAQGGPCNAPTQLPKEQWDRAWEQAKDRVRAYFDPAKPKAGDAPH